MDRLETRELAYFVAVAEELHFGRAAQRLGMAQPPLSRAIKQLERRMGVPLLERSSRHVSLTVAGEALLDDGRRALEAIEAASRRARRAGQADPRLVLAMKPGGDGGLLPDILAAYASGPAAVAVDVRLCTIGEQAALLRSGRADVAFVHSLQPDLSGVETEELLVERQMVVLPSDHRLAGRESVRLADLDGETMPNWQGDAASGAAGPAVHDTGQLIQLIAWGRTVAVLPQSARGAVPRDLVCVPVIDAPATTLLIAWPQGSHSRVIAAFVQAAIVTGRGRQSADPDDHDDPAADTLDAAVGSSLTGRQP
jgi:DNA-binding transcriptional LysR family regulator